MLLKEAQQDGKEDYGIERCFLYKGMVDILFSEWPPPHVGALGRVDFQCGMVGDGNSPESLSFEKERWLFVWHGIGIVVGMVEKMGEAVMDFCGLGDVLADL